MTFADVAGADEAVAELQEIKEFLEAPGRFQALGAKIPKGVLLFGPPGTGKTLLARAVAGEAGVPFFSISGSDFVEMFVGVGASRVRDLFDQAKANAPAIVFMDEIDAVGRHRGAGLGGGHDEREQTLNQLLVEMDGFDVHGGVILIAATNRPDILDPALLRPGPLRPPDRRGPPRPGRPAEDPRRARQGQAAGRRAPTSTCWPSARPASPAPTWPTCSTRRPSSPPAATCSQIGMRECEEAIDRVLAGPERKTLVMSDHDKLVTAYHEAGHAIVGHVLHHADPIHKVSIVARSRSLGLTFTLPGGPLQPLPQPAARRHGHVPRGADGRGAGVLRADHRGRERHREGDPHRPGHGHRVRHERRPRARSSSASPAGEVFLGPRLRPPGQLLRGGGGRHRPGDPPA